MNTGSAGPPQPADSLQPASPSLSASPPQPTDSPQKAGPLQSPNLGKWIIFFGVVVNSIVLGITGAVFTPASAIVTGIITGITLLVTIVQLPFFEEPRDNSLHFLSNAALKLARAFSSLFAKLSSWRQPTTRTKTIPVRLTREAQAAASRRRTVPIVWVITIIFILQDIIFSRVCSAQWRCLHCGGVWKISGRASEYIIASS